jgi:hypothetical protein
VKKWYNLDYEYIWYQNETFTEETGDGTMVEKTDGRSIMIN